MAVRDRIRQAKHLHNKHFICVLGDPGGAANVATTIRNVSAFGVEKLYVVGGGDAIGDFKSSRKSNGLRKLSAGSNKWVFLRRFDTGRLYIVFA